ncbi:hypothetical protein SmaMPs15_000045 [Stenotrophomonas maltophilia phage vB_SmaM_Ps15]|uniref:Uncharacterized protein n=1 Tax=Stenotrophomonas maltophilia phage vB_SmaM_Ps15 TaxID=3071007 RepID=A0AAE9FGI5_9CAUD|nr:hypothetical protein PQC01_gp045 [Stenotrophomonas maltophilia phage vB_SmaM_Ps15]UMO77196.1 hypothetical protein SmaMPs15_000045 [Stenotrophomonas maltophilia phage vB_SmaM_Ps15]
MIKLYLEEDELEILRLMDESLYTDLKQCATDDPSFFMVTRSMLTRVQRNLWPAGMI